jgi:hypothetical protein
MKKLILLFLFIIANNKTNHFMKTKFKLLAVVLFSVVITTINAQEIYLEYDYVTGQQSFYKLDNGEKSVFKSITPSILKDYENIEVIVTNINPSFNQLIFSLKKDVNKDDTLNLASLTSLIKGNIGGYGGFLPGMNSFDFNTRGSTLSNNVFLNPSIISDKQNTEVVDLLVEKKQQYENIKILKLTLERLESQNYPFRTLKDVFFQKVNELGLDSLITKRMDENMINTSFNTLSNNYFISNSLVLRYHETKENSEEVASRGVTSNWEVNGLNYRNTKIEEGLLPFFENDENLEEVLEDFSYIINFQQNLKEENYTQKLLVPLNESYGDVIIRAYSDDAWSDPQDLFTFSVNPKSHFKITTSFGFSFSKFINDKIIGYQTEVEETVIDEFFGDTSISMVDKHGFREVEAEYFPSFGSFVNFSYIKPNKIFNLGFSTGIVVPLREDASAALSVGPTLAIGKGVNKLHINLTYGLAPRKTFNRNEIDFNTLYDDDLHYSEYKERNIYEPTMSIGISWGISTSNR